MHINPVSRHTKTIDERILFLTGNFHGNNNFKQKKIRNCSNLHSKL